MPQLAISGAEGFAAYAIGGRNATTGVVIIVDDPMIIYSSDTPRDNLKRVVLAEDQCIDTCRVCGCRHFIMKAETGFLTNRVGMKV